MCLLWDNRLLFIVKSVQSSATSVLLVSFLKFLYQFISFFYFKNQSCIYVKDLVEDIPDDVDLQNSPGKLSILLKYIFLFASLIIFLNVVKWDLT